MVKDIKKQQKLILKKKELAAKLYNEAADLVLELRPYCDHSETMPYLWEHDNGLTKQRARWSLITGKRCRFCGMINLRHNGGWNKIEDLHD